MTNTQPIPAVVLQLLVNGLGVARCLGRAGVPVIAVADGKRGPYRSPPYAAASRYVREVWPFSGDHHELVDYLLQQGRQLSCRPVLFLVTDISVRCVADRLDELRQYYRIAMGSAQLVSQLTSKIGFARLAAENGMPIPKTLAVDDPSQIRGLAEQMAYPCIIKPDFRGPNYSTGIAAKALLADSPHALVEAYQTFRQRQGRAVIQEIIDGDDRDVCFCLQYYNARSEPLASFTGRKIRQWPPQFGSTTSCEPIRDADLTRLSTAFFGPLGFHGLCSMEFKRSPSSGRLLMIEPTISRTDWQSALADLNGVPIPLIAYRDQIGDLSATSTHSSRRLVATKLKAKTDVRWARWPSDRRAASHYRRSGALSLCRWLWSLRPPIGWSVWALDDPAPTLRDLAQRTKRKFTKLMGRLFRSPQKPSGE